MPYKKSALLVISITLALLLARCGMVLTSSNTSESATEIAAAVIAGAAYATEGGFITAELSAPRPAYAELLGWLQSLTDIQPAFAAGNCPRYETTGTTLCQGGTYEMAYKSCRHKNSSAVWNGASSLAFTPGSNCGTAHLPIHTNGQFVTRTFSNGTTRRGANGSLITLSHKPSGWHVKVGGALTAMGTGSGRDLVLMGLNVTSPKWDYTLSSQTAFSVIGTSGFKTIASGSMNVQENRSKTVGQTTITETLTFSTGCCHPTGGQLTTTFTQGISGSETLSFSSTCGKASYLSNNGNPSEITLTHCL